jgi:hypothetical protein
MRVQINPGAPHSYLIVFTGYTPPTPAGDCPEGFQRLAGPFILTENLFLPPFEAPISVTPAVCRFTLISVVRYLEIVGLALNAVPASKLCGGPAALFPPLQGYLGPACHFNVSATGVTILVIGPGVHCTPPLPPLPPDLAALGPGVTIHCFPGILYAILSPVPGVLPVSLDASGPASFVRVHSPLADTLFTRIGWCAGVPQDQPYTAPTGTDQVLCPTGRGSGFVQACFDSGINTQPIVCSPERRFVYH